MKYVIIIFLQLLISIDIIKAIALNAIAFSYTEKIPFYKSLKNAFNEYSQKNNLDIELNLNILTPENSTTGVLNYVSYIESLLVKKSPKYDIYFYYGSYSNVYSKHFVNLKQFFSDDYINKFSNNIITNSIFNNSLVGLPISVDISVLYSNQILLSKYGKEVPKTWDELISTANYILEKERELNNTELIGYNGLANEDNGIVAFYEFIHSYRDSNYSQHPGIKSQKTIDALKKFKQLKNEISSNSIFRSPDSFTISKLFGDGAIFLKFWYLDHLPIYKVSALPGWKPGVSGSTVAGNNIAISKYVNDTNIEAAVEVLKFFTSEETQKNYGIKNHLMSAIESLYDDEEVCKIIECNTVKDVQPFSSLRFTDDEFGNNYYLKKYKQYMFGYMYEDKPLMDMLENIYNILTIYQFSYKTDNTVVGLIIFIIVIITIALMGLSLAILFVNLLKPEYKFLKIDFWIISITGTIMVMSAIFTQYEKKTVFKCQLRLVLITCGFFFSIAPILYRLIINIPLENVYSKWINNHRYIFIAIPILIVLFLNGFVVITPYYTVEDVIIAEGKNFQKCIIKNAFGKVIYYLEMAFSIFSSIVLLLLNFIEWNLKETFYDVRYIIASVFTDLLSFFLFIIINKLDIKNYLAYNILYICIIYFLSISDYFFIYGIRIFHYLAINKDEQEKERIIRNLIYNTNKFSMFKNKSTDSRQIEKSSNIIPDTIPSQTNFSFAKKEYSTNFESLEKCNFTSPRRASDFEKRLISLHFKE